LPLQERCAYQLDLQDPDHDRFDGAFFNNLAKHAADLKARGSYLVLNVDNELWQAHYGQTPPGVVLLRLDAPPDAKKVLEKHLAARELAAIVPYVQQPAAVRHIQGRNAVQAMRAVDVVVRQWQEYHNRQSSEHAPSAGLTADAASSGGQQEQPLDATLQ